MVILNYSEIQWLASNLFELTKEPLEIRMYAGEKKTLTLQTTNYKNRTFITLIQEGESWDRSTELPPTAVDTLRNVLPHISQLVGFWEDKACNHIQRLVDTIHSLIPEPVITRGKKVVQIDSPNGSFCFVKEMFIKTSKGLAPLFGINCDVELNEVLDMYVRFHANHIEEDGSPFSQCVGYFMGEYEIDCKAERNLKRKSKRH
jgi:hypothetical protein